MIFTIIAVSCIYPPKRFCDTYNSSSWPCQGSESVQEKTSQQRIVGLIEKFVRTRVVGSNNSNKNYARFAQSAAIMAYFLVYHSQVRSDDSLALSWSKILENILFFPFPARFLNHLFLRSWLFSLVSFFNDVWLGK